MNRRTRRLALLATVALAVVLAVWRESAVAHVRRLNRELVRQRPEVAGLPPGSFVYAPPEPLTRVWVRGGYALGRVPPPAFYGGLGVVVLALAAAVVPRRAG